MFKWFKKLNHQFFQIRLGILKYSVPKLFCAQIGKSKFIVQEWLPTGCKEKKPLNACFLDELTETEDQG